MKLFGWELSRAKLKASNTTRDSATPGGDTFGDSIALHNESIYKGYIPTFLYKPPFGYPRPENIPLIKAMAKNPYIHAVITALQEEAAWNSWSIVNTDATSQLDDTQKQKARAIRNFLNNPNENHQGFAHLVKCAVRDICEIDAGVWVKVFNREKELKQLSVLDGGSLLKNPDIHGNIGGRKDIVMPTSELNIDNFGQEEAIKYYDLYYKESAAYFQYGWTVASLPVPFGRREIIYFMKNPRSDSIYGMSPVMILTDILMTLVYGSRYNLDFYLNSNMPEGIIKLLGAQQQQITAFQERLKGQIHEKDAVTGFNRRIGYKIPVVNVEADFIPFQFNSKDMQILEQQAWFTKLVWMAFGVSEQDMGILENSNRSTSQTMWKQYTRRAVRPILELIAERINQQIIPEFDPEGTLMFKWDDYDLDEDIKRHQLYALQIQMGIKTAEMVAEEEHIDLDKLQASKEKEHQLMMQQQQDMMELQGLPGEEDAYKGQRDPSTGKFKQGTKNVVADKAKKESKISGNNQMKMPGIKQLGKNYDRTNPDTKAMTPEQRGFEIERKEHPGFTDDQVMQIVRDHLKEDPNYYS